MKAILFLSAVCFVLLSFLPPQTRTIKGTVLDEKKRPIAGASIMIKGTQTETSTDTAGDFQIAVSSESSTLVISAIGYEMKEYKIAGKDEIIAKLKPMSSSLQEVVVTGYKTQRRQDITGSVQQIKPSNYSPSPVIGYLAEVPRV